MLSSFDHKFIGTGANSITWLDGCCSMLWPPVDGQHGSAGRRPDDRAALSTKQVEVYGWELLISQNHVAVCRGSDQEHRLCDCPVKVLGLATFYLKDH